MSQEKESKAWKKYQTGKELVNAHPEASWLGNITGMKQDQAVRIRTAICLSYGLDIDLRKLAKNQFLQKFTHENNFVPYIDETYDVITKLSVHGVDDRPRIDKSLEEKSEESEELSGGKVK